MRKLALLAILVLFAGCIGAEWATHDFSNLATFDYPPEWGNFTDNQLTNGTLTLTVAQGPVEETNGTITKELECNGETIGLTIAGTEEDLAANEVSFELIMDSFRCLEGEQHAEVAEGH